MNVVVCFFTKIYSFTLSSTVLIYVYVQICSMFICNVNIFFFHRWTLVLIAPVISFFLPCITRCNLYIGIKEFSIQFMQSLLSISAVHQLSKTIYYYYYYYYYYYFISTRQLHGSCVTVCTYFRTGPGIVG